MPKLTISVEGDGHCCHRPSSNWETNRRHCIMWRKTIMILSIIHKMVIN